MVWFFCLHQHMHVAASVTAGPLSAMKVYHHPTSEWF